MKDKALIKIYSSNNMKKKVNHKELKLSLQVGNG